MIEAPNLWTLLEKRVEATPDAVMLVDELDRQMTYAEYLVAAERAAAGLAAEHGVGRGTNVSWQLPTWIESLVLMAALSRLGAVQNPIIPIYREREVGFCLRQTEAALFCVPSVWRGFDFRAMAEGLGARSVLVCDRELPSGDPATLPPPPAAEEGDEVRWLYYTSGTTSDPKGARHTDRTVMASAAGFSLAQGIRSDDIYGVAFPFTHIGGLSNLLSLFQVGFTLILTEAFDPSASIELFARHRATLAGGGPAFYAAFLAEQRRRPDDPILPELRFMTGGGAPMPPEQHFEVEAEIGGAGCAHGYGMTECCIIAMNDPADTDEHKAYTVGRPVRDMEIRIVEGEVRLKGPGVCKGYLDEARNAEAFDDEGWFRTGDMGRFTDDGYLQLTGRAKDIIIRKGENISAQEVEDLLYAHAKVADVGVIGLPDPERGERVCAVVEPADPADPLTMDEMVAFCREQGLMTQKIPEQLEIVEVMPRNPTGKVKKPDLRERYAPG